LYRILFKFQEGSFAPPLFLWGFLFRFYDTVLNDKQEFVACLCFPTNATAVKGEDVATSNELLEANFSGSSVVLSTP
jgi:hypothetical protein